MTDGLGSVGGEVGGFQEVVTMVNHVGGSCDTWQVM